MTQKQPAQGWPEVQALGQPMTDEEKRAAYLEANKDALTVAAHFISPEGKKVLEIFRKWAEAPGFMPSSDACKDGHMMSLLQNFRIGEYNFYRRILKAIDQGRKTK
jgi:hypothetical protein